MVKIENDFFVCGIYQTKNLRMTIEEILYKLRTGCPWRDVPSAFGQWNSIFRCFNRWSLHGKLKEIFYALAKDPDHEWIFIDGSIVKAHQHSSGAVRGNETAIGKSVAGNSTKIHMAVDAMGLPIQFIITGGEVHDSKMAHIPRKKNSKIGNEKMDWCLYKYRHLVENIFARLKHFRSIATRYEKLKRNYEGMLYLACAIVWLPM